MNNKRLIFFIINAVSFMAIFINRVLLNEYYSGVINSGYFYFLFCKDFEQHLFVKHLQPIITKINNNQLKVLDFGCGPGIMSVFFDNYVGIDTDKSRIDFAVQQFPNKQFMQIELITEYSRQLPFYNNIFDVVLFNDCIHHINNHDMKFIIIDIHRILRLHGVIIIREPKKNTNVFTYIMTEVFENGDYVRNTNEYKQLFKSDYPVYEKSHYEIVRDYYVYIVNPRPDVAMTVTKPFDIDSTRIIIKYSTLLLSTHMLYVCYKYINII